MVTESTQQQAARQRHNRWLVLIGGFKIVEGLLFILLGLGIVRLLHRDLADLLVRTALALRIDPESHLVNLLLDKVQMLTPHRMRLIGVGVFLKAGLDFVEGFGLALEKTWAEWFTIGLTASFLPWELYELFHHLTWVKVVITLINLLVLAYLVWLQRMRLHWHRRETGSSKKM
jgi:uncharacterized membrane protein (DUF2068 family)